MSLNLYKQQAFFLQHKDKDILLRIIVKPYMKKGSNKDVKKLIDESLIKITWVFLYTAQKAEMKYQKARNNIKVDIKNATNLAFMQSIISIIFLPFLGFLDKALISYIEESVILKKHK